MSTTTYTFQNTEGHELSAKLDLPAAYEPQGFALFAHCFTCSKDLKAMRSISRALNQSGYAVLRFDFTGLGDSGGEFAETGFTANVSDLIAAADFLKEEFSAPSLLVGHSLGGAAVLHAAAQIDSVRAVATIGAPAEASHVLHLIKAEEKELENNGQAEVTIGGRPFNISKSFIDDLKSQKGTDVVASLRKPLVIYHSPQDDIVSIDEAAKIYHAAMHPKSFISLNGADHLLSKSADGEYVGSTLAAWAERYVEPRRSPELESHLQSAARTDNREGFLTEVVAGGHPLLADEPAKAGGSDLGPTPYDLLTAALATCSAMTMKMYAQRKSWKLTEALVHVEHDRIHHEDSGEEKKRYIDTFKKVIELQGDLDEDQRKRLIEIASRCPVHRTLQNEIRIHTEINDG